MTADQAASDFPREGRLLGLDYGTRRIGIAVSTPEQTISSPLENYQRRSERLDAEHLRQLATDYRIAGLIVGLPVHMSGEEGGKAREARAFGEWASRETGRPVRYWDERFTSALAEDALREAKVSFRKRRDKRDRIAAQLMLQAYLDAGCPSG